MRRLTTAACLALTGVALATPAYAQNDDPGGGTQIGGSVPSFMSLSLTVNQATKTVLAAVTSTDSPTTLSVADAAVFTPFADPLIAMWAEPIASAAKTIHATANRTILVTVSSGSP